MELDFEKDLSINKYRLDEECLSHPTLYFRYSEAAVEAKSQVSAADDNLKLVLAERNIAIRKAYTDQGIKFTEALIASELDKDEEVLKARKRYRKYQELHSKIQVAVSAMESRRSCLDNLVKLYCSGYFSTIDGKKKDVREEVSESIRKNLNKSKEE